MAVMIFGLRVSSMNLIPFDELLEVLNSKNSENLFIGGVVDLDRKTITLLRGNFTKLIVPFSLFEESGTGVLPDFNNFSIIDYGQTVCLGFYEAAADAILNI